MKRKIVSIVLAASMIFTSVATANATIITTDDNSNSENRIAKSSAVNTTAYKQIENLSEYTEKDRNNIMLSTKDEEGNAMGPSSYAVSSNGLVVLNTANNSILSVNDSHLKKVSLDDFDIIGIDLSLADNEDIYILDNDLNVYRVGERTAKYMGTAKNEMTLDNAADFNVVSEYVYVSEPTIQGGQTHQYSFDGESGTLVYNQTIPGYMVDENTFYQSKIMTKDEQATGPKCMVNLFNADGDVIDKIVLTSNHDIAGVQYLGKNAEGLHVIKQFDMVCDDDGSFDIEETIRTIDKNSVTKTCVAVENSIPSMDDQIEIQDGKVYYFESTNSETCIFELNTEHLPGMEEFTSSLPDRSISSETVDDTQKPVASSPKSYVSVTRNAVMADAQAYHSNFTWTCYAKNLASLTNWTKPRYIGGAGTYSYMPYCWGGFSTVAQFNAGMSGTGRVGNINTSTSGHVSNTYGLDCSGFISRVWYQPQKYGTSTINQISYGIPASSLLRGDALNKSGSHIVLYHYADGSGRYILYEATKLNSYDRVSHTARNISSMTGYSAIRYYGITG